MIRERRLGDVIADTMITIVTVALSAACVFPFFTLTATSLSSRLAVQTNLIIFWPIGFNLDNYVFLIQNVAFVRSFAISVARILTGVPLTLLVIVLTAYALSQDQLHIPGRTVFKVIMVFGMLFQGGLIPTYLAYKSLGLLNRFAVLVVPGALNIFFAILITNFFREIPRELTESALLDGASHFQVLFRIFLPLSLPSLATVSLFAAVGHWNSWFDGIVFLRHANRWPLQSYLYAQVTEKALQQKALLVDVISSNENAQRLLQNATPEALAAAMVVIGTVPILIVYPFVQRYFVKGLTLGAVKG